MPETPPPIDAFVAGGHFLVTLRDVIESDLPLFFEQQRDPIAVQVAAFTPKDPNDRAAFAARWNQLLGADAVIKKTIVVAGRVAGSVLKFELDGKPEITYWIGREFWGLGIATRALAEFLGHVPVRPLYARAAKDNVGSIRVLSKCGFRITGEGRWFANARGAEIDEVMLELGAGASPPPTRPLGRRAGRARRQVRMPEFPAAEDGGTV